MVSWGEEGVLTLEDERRQRCLACGVRLESSPPGPGTPRCASCLATNRPLDLVMRWIWQSDDVGH